MNSVRFSAITLLVGLSVAVLSCGRRADHSAVKAVPTVSAQAYPDSTSGLQAQFADIVNAARSRDEATLRTAIDSLRMPNADQWIAANFEPRLVPQLVQEYAEASSTFQSHVRWVMENFAKFDDFALQVGPFGTSEPPVESGFESLLPRPVERIDARNCRFTSTATNPKHGPPSWVSSFVYVDGRFRFVGGTYPFWAEKLAALRGPMSLPPATIHGMTVQGVAFQKEVSGPGVIAVVQLRVDIAHDGHVSRIMVLSGEEPFVQDAKDYMKAANFGVLPDVPGLAKTTEWDMAVAFFKPRN